MTRRFFSLSALALAALFAAGGSLRADTISPHGTAPDFKEVYELLRTNLADTTAENLNRVVVEKSSSKARIFVATSRRSAFPTCCRLWKLAAPGF